MFPPQAYGRVDIFSSMDSIPSRTDDFRHIGPHIVEPRAAERTGITGPGYGYTSGLSLVPLFEYDVGGPIRVSHSRVFRVKDLGDNLAGTGLDTPEAVLADMIDCVRKLICVEGPLVVSVINTFAFYTLEAAQAPTFPIEDGALSYWSKSRRRCLSMNAVFFRHFKAYDLSYVQPG